MNIYNKTWATLTPTKKERRIKAIKNVLIFSWQVFYRLAFIAVIWAAMIIILSL